MFFIVYTKDNLYLFNLLNLNYEIWGDLKGNINSVIINDNGKYILVSTDYVECPIYIIYHSSLNFFNKSRYDINEYDVEQNYIQNEYHFFHKIYNMAFSKGYIIKKMQINLEQNRVLVLYCNYDADDYQTQAMLFLVDLNKDINNLNMEFLLPVNNVNNLCVTNFESCFNLQREVESFLMVFML